MSAWDDYITLSTDTPSRSGLYATSLPGVPRALLDDLTKEEQADDQEFFDSIYNTSKINFTSDVQGKLGKKFHYDQKLVTRETSKFLEDENTGTQLAGIKIESTLPKYARLHVLSVGVFAESASASPGLEINFYDTDEDGELLHTIDEEISAGRNTLNVDTDFEVDKLFIVFDPNNFSLRKTENKYFNTTGYDKLECTFPCGDPIYGYGISVSQIQGGGLNVKFVVSCSVDKFICENINLFKTAFWYRIGVELMRERILSDRFNRFTTLTTERANELMNLYQDEYEKHLNNAVDSMNIDEDPICFECKNIVESKPLIP